MQFIDVVAQLRGGVEGLIPLPCCLGPCWVGQLASELEEFPDIGEVGRWTEADSDDADVGFGEEGGGVQVGDQTTLHDRRRSAWIAHARAPTHRDGLLRCCPDNETVVERFALGRREDEKQGATPTFYLPRSADPNKL